MYIKLILITEIMFATTPVPGFYHLHLEVKAIRLLMYIVAYVTDARGQLLMHGWSPVGRSRYEVAV